MSRPNTFRVLIFPVLMLIVVIMTACGGNAEEQTLFNKYFMSSRINDNLTLQNITTVAFDPATDGQMVSFSITLVGEEKSASLTLKAGAEEIRKAVAAELEFTKSKKAFQEANDVAIERVLKAEDKNQKLTGKDLETQKIWTKWRDDAKAMSQKVSAVKKRGNEHRPIVEISILDQRNPIDVTAYDGDMTTKEVTIQGKVKTPAGETVAKDYIFTMQRATLKNVNGKDQIGRWVITGRREAGK
jgi:outer membrane lipopolysaccharide assembly protein LptE/RlpB